METPTHPPMVRTGSEQPLGDTPDALAEKVAPETTSSEHNKENIPPDTPKLPPKSLRGREQRLKEIQNALAGLKVVSTLSTKRPSESSTLPPTAKRLRLEAVQTLQLHDADRHKYIHEFFAQYPNFNYNPRFSVTNEFRRMCKSFGWRRSYEFDCLKDDGADREYGVARQAFDDAMAQQFNYIYGTDLEDISSWKDLCKVLGIIPIPKGLEECQDVSNLDCLLS